MSREQQALCFTAGANSIFVGAQLLTTPLPGEDADSQLMRDLGLRPMPIDAEPAARVCGVEGHVHEPAHEPAPAYAS